MEIIQQFKNRLLIKNVSESTSLAYVRIAKVLLDFDSDFFSLPQEDIISFLSKKVKDGMSASYLTQHIAVIQFIRNNILDIQDKIKIPKPIRDVVIPDVLTKEEFQRMFFLTHNKKHKAILALMYSAGLRVSEATNLLMKDIDSGNEKIIIRKAKGKVDRVVMLDSGILLLLKEYWREYKTVKYLFEGQKGDKYSTRSIQLIVKRAAKLAGIKKKISSHSLRHSCFTQLVRDGVDLRLIQRLAGHKNINTTAGYIRTSDEDVLNIKSPIKGISF